VVKKGETTKTFRNKTGEGGPARPQMPAAAEESRTFIKEANVWQRDPARAIEKTKKKKKTPRKGKRVRHQEREQETKRF